MAAREPLLTVADVASILRVSLNTARRIMREERAIQVGKQLRWTQTKLERYLRAGGSNDPCHASEPLSKTDCINAVVFGGSPDTTLPANDTESPPTKRNGSPQLKLLGASKSSELFPPIAPRVKRKSSR